MTEPKHAAPQTNRWVLVLVLYLSGLFMGALDTGIITPARTIIQSDLGVDEKTGIWMITVYTLAYAAAIPVMGKLADRMGRKPVYLIAIGLFGFGSLMCGMSEAVGSFELLIIARIIQALGAGGIVPIATAEVGTSVPEEKRGMALGLVGGVYGIANVFGASAGSLILDIVGIENWQWIFYINIPIAIAIILIGAKMLPAAQSETSRKLDLAGITVLVALIVALLYGLQNLDFFNLRESLADPNVWPFLLGALVCLPVLILIEMRAADPVLNLRYFSDRVIGTTLLLAALSGVVMMSIVFVPQFAENSLAMRAGSGGYLVVILGLASGVGAPMSGRLTDKYGPRAVLGTGALISLAAAATLVWWTAPHPSMFSVVLALILMGLGLGFLIGSPINYLLLKRVPERESTSSMATMSLVRAVGTTLAPAILVGLLANSLAGMSTTVMGQLPSAITMPALPHAAELQQKFDDMAADPRMAEALKGMEIPDLTQTSIDIDMGGSSGALPEDLQLLMRTADVTTIVDRSVTVAERMFDEQKPERVAAIQEGVQKAIAAVETQAAAMPDLPATAAAKAEMEKTAAQLQELSDAAPGAFDQARDDYVAEIRANGDQLESTFQHELNMGFVNLFWFYGIACLLMLGLLAFIPSRKALNS
ncbi:MAG: MFS transporter [Propionibacteriaceae bacterium]|nr:MFS transporter [Propionibacteriaceae bacterium]